MAFWICVQGITQLTTLSPTYLFLIIFTDLCSENNKCRVSSVCTTLNNTISTAYPLVELYKTEVKKESSLM